MFDHRAGVLADLDLLHFADLGSPRDRLEFSGSPATGRVYGRDGNDVFAEMYGMAWQPLQKKAAEELQVFGLLLRFPWGFDSGTEFLVAAKENITLRGVAKVRLRVQRRAGKRDLAMGLQRRTDRFDLICDPQTMLPEALHMTLAASGSTVVVEFDDYAWFGGVRIPTRRIFFGPTGKRVMELRIRSMDLHQAHRPSLFRARS